MTPLSYYPISGSTGTDKVQVAFVARGDVRSFSTRMPAPIPGNNFSTKCEILRLEEHPHHYM